MAFRGTFDYTLDAKNRLTVPAKFRRALADGVVLAKGVERLRRGLAARRLRRLHAAALGGLQPALAARRASSSRFFAANSHDTELDSAGRVASPAS